MSWVPFSALSHPFCLFVLRRSIYDEHPQRVSAPYGRMTSQSSVMRTDSLWFDDAVQFFAWTAYFPFLFYA